MNHRFAIRLTALSLIIVAAGMLPVAVWCVVEGTAQQWAAAKALGWSSLGTALICVAVSMFARPRSQRVARETRIEDEPSLFPGSRDRNFGRREAFLMVTLTWILAPAIAGLPFLLWAHGFSPSASIPHPFHSLTNCYFEAMSGLTTTGASILSDIEGLPRGLLLWRSATHWLGGLGIVLLFVAVLPMMGVASRKLHSVESSGPLSSDAGARIRDTARTLWISYLVITMISILALRAAGLPWFNALCETFGAIATGGFSVQNESISAYHSATVDAIIVLVMILGAVNFARYSDLAGGRWRRVWRDPELRILLAVVLGGSLVVVLAIYGTPARTIAGGVSDGGWFAALRYGVFNFVSMQTDTGFATADFDLWPSAALLAICVGTFIGGSAGSTTGGIKVVRVLVAGKILVNQIQGVIRPSVIKPVRLGNRALSSDEQMSLLVAILWFVIALFVGTFLLKVWGSQTGAIDMRTAFSASLANLCTAGPGLGGVGPTRNYLWLSDSGKWILCLLMLVGRLEIIPVITLLHPRFWSTK